MTVRNLTDNQRKALKILQVHEGPNLEGITPSQFALYFWPQDHPGWKKLMRGRNSVNHNHLYLMAGSYLGRLFSIGLVQTQVHQLNKTLCYIVSPSGKKALKTGNYNSSR